MRAVANLFVLVGAAACSGSPPSADDGPDESSGTSTPSETSSAPGSTSSGPPETTTTTGAETTTTEADTTTSGGESTTTTDSSSGGESGSSSSSSGSTGEAGCTPFSADGLAAAHFEPGLTTYETDATTAIGGALPDRFQLGFYSNAPGTFDLASVGVNDNYQTCSQCVRVMEDLDEDDFLQRWYFQSEGSIEVDDTADPWSGAVHATLQDVVLIEVLLDPVTWHSTPVEDGQCLVLDSPMQIDVEL